MSAVVAHDAPEFWLFGLWEPHMEAAAIFRQKNPWLGHRLREALLAGLLPYFRLIAEAHIIPRLTLASRPARTIEAPRRLRAALSLIERSYWEKLTDHHGCAPDKVWGVAYRIRPERVTEVKDYLDIREINGYSIHYTPFHPADGSPTFRALVYIGTPDNEQFFVPQDPQHLAQHILASRGPSGLNKEYLYNLQHALDELSPESGDTHVTDLARRVRMLEMGGTAAAEPDFKHSTSTQ